MSSHTPFRKEWTI